MTIVHLTYPITFIEASAIIKWLENNVEHKFTGEGMEEITFQDGRDAILFKLMFSV